MTKPLVGIIMGSVSDLPVMQEAVRILEEEFGVPCEVGFKSAHRTAEEMAEYARTAKSRGLKVIIAGAGGAAALPGMIEAFEVASVPVIGVPIKTSALAGIDSLFSIVQMPPGRPVGTMAINGAKNAGIYAAQILALSDEEIARKVEAFQQRMHDEVIVKNDNVNAVGWRQYLTDNGLL